MPGAYRRRPKGCTVRDPKASPHPDLVNRQFTASGPDRLWLTDITQHRTTEGWVYCAVVLDAWSRRVIGWSIADHLRTELVTDALEMARLRRKPDDGHTVLHSDHGCQYTSWAFGQRLRQAGLLGSMGSIGDCYDNSMMESFFGSLQIELLDQKTWTTRQELASAIFEWIEAWYNPERRHSVLAYNSTGQLRANPPNAARRGGMISTTNPSGKPGEGQWCAVMPPATDPGCPRWRFACGRSLLCCRI